MIKINEIYHSIQGEGVMIGTPTTFIRLAGCNLRCEWCDTIFAYDEGVKMSIDDILEEVENIGCFNVCVTGGEPLDQENSLELIEELADHGYLVTLETNGSITLEELPCTDYLLISMDMKCPSSGMDKKMLMSNIELLGPNDQLKFVISDDIDYVFAKGIIDETQSVCNIIITPVGGKDLKILVEWVLRDGLNVRVLPQLHKLIWGDRRGV